MPSLHGVIARWNSSKARVDDHMADQAHFDNFVNTWHVNQLVATVCDVASESRACFAAAPQAQCAASGACGFPDEKHLSGRLAWHSRCAIDCQYTSNNV